MVQSASALRVPNSLNGTLRLPYHLRRGPRPPSWHPKITPYRFIVLITTIAMGTTKAVLTERGSTRAPVTLEWLMGTALFLLVFSISAYDSREIVPRSLSWLFEHDCMDLVWLFLGAFSMPRPEYTSEEKPIIANIDGDFRPVTLYRILVCSVVASFGLSKAVLGYYGLSTAVTWTDWALAVPATTLLYVLGLYEYNSSNMWPSFFVVDRSEEFNTIVGIGIMYMIGVFLSAGWTLMCGYVFWYVSTDPSWDILRHPDKYKITIRMHVEDVTKSAWRLFLQECLLLGFILGVTILFGVARLAVKASGMDALGRLVWDAVRCRVVHLVAMIVPSVAEESLRTGQPWSRYRSLDRVRIHLAFRIFIHIAIYLVIMIGCFTFAMLSLSCTIMLVDVVWESNANLSLRVWVTAVPISIGLVTLGFVFALFRLIYAFLAPCLYYLEARPWTDSLTRLI